MNTTKHDIVLFPRPACGREPVRSLDDPLTFCFRWDERAGTIEGRDAERVLEWIASAASCGFVSIQPPPNGYKLGANPLTSRVDMAAIFGQFHILPPFLEEAMPHGDSGSDVADIPGVVF